MTDTKHRLQRYRAFKVNPTLAGFLSLEEQKQEVRALAETILERELAKLNQRLNEKMETFLESGRGEKIVERIIGDTDIAGAILKTGLTLKGGKGEPGRNPLFIGKNLPNNPQIGDLWYQS